MLQAGDLTTEGANPIYKSNLEVNQLMPFPQPQPFNTAEAILEPFWDPQLSQLDQWRIEPGTGHGLEVRQNWCWVAFEWARRPADPAQPALRMTRRYDADGPGIDCAGYDALIASIMAPEQSVCVIRAETDAGELSFSSPPAPQLKKEYRLELRGASRLRALTLEVYPARDGVSSGWLNWIGLQNTALVARQLAQWDRFDARWDGYLKPESFEPSFQPAYGLLVDAGELEQLRARHAENLARYGRSPFTQAGQAAAQYEPERFINEFVNFWGDTRYNRERDHGKYLLAHGPNAAIAGLLLRDKHLHRLGARYAMSLAMCEHWDDGMICDFPGSNFEHRCFVQSLCAHETALLLDLCGEWFTDSGREYVLRRIMEEGLGAINFNTWKHEYIFHCNQLAWFTPGRMLAYALVERFTPRAQPYTEIAYRELIESLSYTILPDGGYVEGPTYFRCVGRDAGLSLYYYAHARKRPFASVVLDVMLRTADFGAAVASTDESADVIPICDAGLTVEHEMAAVMAAVLPDSQWVSIYHKAVARAGGLPNALLAFKLAADIPAQAAPPPAFVFLPAMGVMASTRRLNGEWVKLLIMGNQAGAGHTHEDKGSFVLEFAGETFGMDPGTCDYSHPLADELKNCERHNMLIPSGTSERPHPECPLMVDVKPEGAGDETSFHARIDASAGWGRYYRTWIREWNSPAPDTLLIRDEYELIPESGASGVEFCWNTQRQVTVEGNIIVLRGKRGAARIEAPADCAIRVDELPLLNRPAQRRIVIQKAGVAGVIEVRVTLERIAQGETA